MKVPQDIIDEAAKNGIVEGAVIQCVTTHGRPLFGTVQNVCDWNWTGTNLLVGKDQEGISLFAKNSERWATVIEPAPSQGLEEGMATECSPAMRAAIIERAAELGLSDGFAASYNNKWITWCDDCGTCPIQSGKHGENILTPLDFLTRLEATGKKPKPLKIGEWNVKFEKGSIEVGCQRITNETVRAIAAKLVD